MNILVTTQKKFNLCRLHKEYYFVTDLLDSQNRYLHQDVFSPTHKRPNLGKFRTVQVPAPCWRVQETAIKPIYQSMRVSRHMIRPPVNKKMAIWLQHVDESHILRNCGNNLFIKCPLVKSTRTICKYTRRTWNALSIEALECYRVVKLFERNGIIYTDGYGRRNTLPSTKPIPAPSPYTNFYTFTNKVISAWK